MFKNYRGISESARLIIRSASSSSTSFKVVTGNGYTYTGSANATNPATLIISNSVIAINNSYSHRNKGIHVFSTGSQDISVLVVNYRTYSRGEYLAHPHRNLALERYEYFAVSTGTLVNNGWSLVLLVGCEDVTTITITPSQTVTIYANAQTPNSPQRTVVAGSSYTILLNRLQTYLFGNSTSDMSGTRIVSNKPLTVVSGHECGNVPSSATYCEHIAEQMLPTVTWGTEFLLAPYDGRTAGQYYKVITSKNATTFTTMCNSAIAATTITLTNSGSSSTFQTAPEVYCSVVSNNPITIYQLAPGYSLDRVGDPNILTIPAVDHYDRTVYFTTPDSSEISNSYISITVTASQFSPSSILLNNQKISCQWNSIYNSSGFVVGYGCTESVAGGSTHNVQHAGPGAGLGVLVYGFKTPREGYGYCAGVTYPSVRPGIYPKLCMN